MKKDSSTESWGKAEMRDERIQLAQTNPNKIHFIMPFTFHQLGDVSGKSIQPTEWVALLSSGTVDVVWRHRTIQDYVKMFIKCGLTITDLHEPVPTDEQAAVAVGIDWMQRIPIFMFWELRK